jgi:DNA adenine methylase
MFRYNSNGGFNVPYGGIGYNRKNFQKKVNYLKSKELKSLLFSTIIENLDFEDFFKKHNPTNKDFIFLDPPYDSEFSTYTQNEFNKNDQKRLANYLTKKCKAKWMLIIKNTDFIYNLYDFKNLNVKAFNKTYLVSFMNRNDKNVEHLLITNY